MEFSEFAAKRSFTPQQERSIRHLDGPLLISAGAGSGKTYTLQQRVLWALTPGSGVGDAAFLDDVDEVLVITFTERAAAEVKGRIRSALREEGMLEQSLKVDGAWISTIHGMCNRILREHALEVGLDPSFSVIDNVAEEELRMDAIQQALARSDGNEGSPYQVLFDTMQDASIRECLGAILNEASHLPTGLTRFHCEPAGSPPGPLVGQLLSFVEDMPDDATEVNLTAAEELRARLSAWIEGGGADIEELAAAIQGKKGKFGKTSVAHIKNAIAELEAACTFAPFAGYSQLLYNLACDADAIYQETLGQLGVVDLTGLIRTTLDVFERYPQIAQFYQDKFKLIMVDEFQDTSQLQIDMIEKIAGPDARHLCTVGDAQQSIYRFQGADVGVYLRHKREMVAKGAEVVQLDDNFRSHTDVLSAVRKLCGQPGYFQEPFLDLQARTEGKPYKGSALRIEVALSHHAYSQRKLAPWWEARYIAERLAQLKSEGHAEGDMVVLMGQLTHAGTFARALRDAGLSCVVTGGSRYYASSHVRTCLSLLHVLANPLDSEHLLTLLSGEMLPISTEDLLNLATYFNDETSLPTRQNLAIGLLSPEKLTINPSPQLERAIQVLNRAWAKLGRVRPDALVQQVILESGWLARLQAGDANEQAKAADVLKFIRLVRDAQERPGTDMVQVAAMLDVASEATREKPGSLAVENLDAVRIMTIHASKGLEFPVVAIAQCYEGRPNSSPLYVHTENGETYLSFAKGVGKKLPVCEFGVAAATDPATLRGTIIAHREQAEHEERMRLFYVALTRASAAAIVMLSGRYTQSGGYLPAVQTLLAGMPFDQGAMPQSSCGLEYDASEPLQFTFIEIPEDAELPDMSAAVMREVAYPPLVEDVRPVRITPRTQGDFYSYSSLAKLRSAKEPKATDTAEPMRDPEDEAQHAQGIQDRDKATEFGSALHKACEWLVYQGADASEEEVEAYLYSCAHTFGVKGEQRLAEAFERWRTSEARTWAQGFDQLQAEVPFTVQVAGNYLEGEIDLLAVRGTSAGVVDYKTGGSPDETPDQLQAKHLLQAQCYAYALLVSGYQDVELRFVRVEQEDPDDPNQPQVVCYAFSHDDVDALATAISL